MARLLGVRRLVAALVQHKMPPPCGVEFHVSSYKDDALILDFAARAEKYLATLNTDL
jgi:hypothetical protein